MPKNSAGLNVEKDYFLVGTLTPFSIVVVATSMRDSTELISESKQSRIDKR